MRELQSPAGYAAAAKWIHWITAACVLTLIPVGIAMGRVQPGPLQDGLFNAHKAFGTLVLMLAILRVIVRVTQPRPAPHPTLTPLQRVASTAVHEFLYLLIFVQPVLGLLANAFYGAAVPFFGLFEIKPFLPHNEPLSEILFRLHRWCGFLMAAVVAAHVGAALMHLVIFRDGVFSRMWPQALTWK